MTYTEEELYELMDENIGICKNCKEEIEGTEPDIENGTCPCCGSHSVMGIENALLIGIINECL